MIFPVNFDYNLECSEKTKKNKKNLGYEFKIHQMTMKAKKQKRN